ncbi:tryptophan synthase subunit alpha [Helicobacter turcicus]|uniref:Tryptophan synthase alpha chain n=1 Tax=Helicobacter turcicus TaxID=2867412 RepID=A0ABS7JM68_9HELI|nr:tryptophan synthase subunit alpha [Helicobacter turcicus]MBX7490494.1 tryptophan synthase subunit alpha [Helicobacter turcicus]MBX7545354.1 tryptophan synthase subunit alpha [Helicobacter turcicus]
MKDIALMGHIVAGFPSFTQSLDSAIGIALGGAKYLEVQFPFSDPNADGIAIANACEIALKNGFNTDFGFRFITELQEKLKAHNCHTKLLIMTYGNILFCYGIREFLLKAKEVGVYGLIVPDFSLQNDENLFKYSKKLGLENIALIAPFTTPKRMRALNKASGEILYVVARNGITGDTTTINQNLLDYIALVKENCTKPIALGFGIQNKEQIQSLRGIVPIAVVGSAFVRHITELCQSTQDSKTITESLRTFTQNLLGE